jgi:hypothetical protein
MKAALAVVMLAALLLGLWPGEARADASTDAALALGAFAVLNQLVRGETILHDLWPRPVVRETVVVQPVVVQQPVVVPPPVVVHQPAVVVPGPVVYQYVPTRVYYVPAHVPPGHLKKWYRAHWKHWDP